MSNRPEAGESRLGGGQTVMVVDDEPALVELAEELLVHLGYKPVGFTSCEAALGAFEANPDRFDVVLSDVMLPGMNGQELAERLSAIRPQLPILLASGNVSDEMEVRARAANVAAVLRKPLTSRELSHRLAMIFGTARRT